VALRAVDPNHLLLEVLSGLDALVVWGPVEARP
jgi:hypothetical protein